MKKLALIFSVLPVLAMATSFRSDNSDAQAANQLVTLDATVNAAEGVVLKTSHFHPYTNYLVGIPAQVNTGSACTEFVGQQTSSLLDGPVTIQAIGATNPMQDACIAVMPMPVKTLLTVNMKVLTGGIVAADRYHRQVVAINKMRYLVQLDIYESKVQIQRLFKHQMHQ